MVIHDLLVEGLQHLALHSSSSLQGLHWMKNLLLLMAMRVPSVYRPCDRLRLCPIF